MVLGLVAALACAPGHAEDCKRVEQFPEHPNARCQTRHVLKGLECKDANCAHKILTCCPYTSADDHDASVQASDWKPEFRSEAGFVNGLDYDYDDNKIRGIFVRSRRLPNTGECNWTGFFSVEAGYRSCPEGRSVAGLSCKGAHCGSLRLYCCGIASPANQGSPPPGEK